MAYRRAFKKKKEASGTASGRCDIGGPWVSHRRRALGVVELFASGGRAKYHDNQQSYIKIIIAAGGTIKNNTDAHTDTV